MWPPTRRPSTCSTAGGPGEGAGRLTTRRSPRGWRRPPPPKGRGGEFGFLRTAPYALPYSFLGYDGKLNIRPKYQREFICNAKQRDAVLKTIRKGFPLNVMYWAANEDGTYEVLDGQQRTISFCQYVAGDFSINIGGYPMAMHNLTQPQKDQILN